MKHNPFCSVDSCVHVHHDCRVIGCHGEPDRTYLRGSAFRPVLGDSLLKTATVVKVDTSKPIPVRTPKGFS